MAVTYGFYNGSNHDRKYYAIQMSSIFDGIIRDGIFMSIGTCLVVEATGDDMVIRVGEGRAWFDHTWTLNDAILPIEVPQSEIILNRIDAVVLEINQDRNVRENSIKIIPGTPATEPVRPEMIKTATVKQYPLAYIFVEKGVTSIRQADITNMVGSGDTPYVTGILETVNIEAMVAQWEDQWTKWLEEKETEAGGAIDDLEELIKKQTEYLLNTTNEWNMQWSQWFYQYTSSNSEAFETWFENLEELLEPDVAANLANKLLKLEKKIDDFIQEKDAKYGILLDSNGEPILDSDDSRILVASIDGIEDAELKENVLELLSDPNVKEQILSIIRDVVITDYNTASVTTATGYLIDASVFGELVRDKLGDQVTYSVDGKTLIMTSVE